HQNGAELDRADTLRLWRSFLVARDFTLVCEPLATLGESLALSRQTASSSGVARGQFDVGAYERPQAVLIEVDRDGRRRRTEAFAVDRLGGAVARLYERYAEILPDGPARDRAAATARSVAAVLNRLRDPDAYAAVLAPDVEFLDHQPVGLPPGRGAKAFLRGLRTLIELTDDTTLRVDAVL